MDKWIAIMIVGVMFALFAPISCMEHQKAQCRIEAIKAGVDAEKIGVACGMSK